MNDRSIDLTDSAVQKQKTETKKCKRLLSSCKRHVIMLGMRHYHIRCSKLREPLTTHMMKNQ
jgi:hypothetical protein